MDEQVKEDLIAKFEKIFDGRINFDKKIRILAEIEGGIDNLINRLNSSMALSNGYRLAKELTNEEEPKDSKENYVEKFISWCEENMQKLKEELHLKN